MPSVNRKAIGGIKHYLDSAGDYTQAVRWLKEAIITPAPVHTIITTGFNFNLLRVATLIINDQLSNPQLRDQCIDILYFGGVVDTTVFYEILNGETVSIVGNTLLDGGTPYSNFCQ
jgi:hypothetical protein